MTPNHDTLNNDTGDADDKVEENIGNTGATEESRTEVENETSQLSGTDKPIKVEKQDNVHSGVDLEAEKVIRDENSPSATQDEEKNCGIIEKPPELDITQRDINKLVSPQEKESSRTDKKEDSDASALSIEEENLETMYHATEHFKKNLAAAVGDGVFTQVSEVCRSLDEQSNKFTTGTLEFDQFLQVLKAFGIKNVSEGEVEAIFNSFCAVGQLEGTDVLHYETFLENLGFGRSEAELMDLMKASLIELMTTDQQAQAKMEEFFSHYNSEKRESARSAAAAEDRLIDFDTTSYEEFHQTLRTLGVGFSEREVRQLFGSLRAGPLITPASILSALEEGGSALIELFQSPLSQKEGLDKHDMHSSSSRAVRRRQKDTNKDHPSIKGLRSAEDVLRNFQEVFTLIKSFLPLPQPVGTMHCWHIANLLLMREELLYKLPKGSAMSVSAVTLMDYVREFKSLALSIPEHYHSITSLLDMTRGELNRLIKHINKTLSPDTFIAADTDGVNNIGLQALLYLLDCPRDEGYFIKGLFVDLDINNMVSDTIACKKMRPLSDNFASSAFVFQVRTLVVKGDGDDEIEELSSVRVSPKSNDNGSLVWEATGETMALAINLDETALIDPCWRLVVELLEVGTPPSPDAEPSAVADAYETPNVTTMTYFLGHVSFSLRNLVDYFVSMYSLRENGAKFNSMIRADVGFNGAKPGILCDAKLDISTFLANMMTGQTKNKVDQVGTTSTYLLAAQGQVSILQYLVSDIVNAILKKSKLSISVAEDIDTRIVSKRRARRQKAQSDGHVGGKPVASRDHLATLIQSLWRSKKVRKYLVKSFYASITIQSAFRGFSQRNRYKKTLSGRLYAKSLEDAHKVRLKSLRSKEQGAAHGQENPGSEFLNFERMRRDSSAKVLQRAWRVKFSNKYRGGKTKSGAVSAAAAALNKKVEDIKGPVKNLRNMNLLANIQENTRLNKLDGIQACDFLPIELEEDAMGLAQLHRRTKDDYIRKRQDNNGVVTASTFGNMQQILRKDKGNKVRESGRSARESYKELVEIQRKAETLLEDYLGNREEREASKLERLRALGHTRSLSSELKLLPSLAEAKQQINSLKTRSVSGESKESLRELNKESWYTNVPLETLPDSIERHLKTIDAMRNSSRWGVAASPNDVTGPPIDIGVLSESDRAQLSERDGSRLSSVCKGLAKAWVKGENEDNSLLWVSYCAQPSKCNDSSREAMSELNDVLGTENNILQKLSRDKNAERKTYRDCEAVCGT